MPLRLLAELRTLLEADTGPPHSRDASASAAPAAKPARQRTRRTAASTTRGGTTDQPAAPVSSVSAPSGELEQGTQLNGARSAPLNSEAGAPAWKDTSCSEAVHADEWSQMMARSVAKARERIWGSTAVQGSAALASTAGAPPKEGSNAQPAASSVLEAAPERAGVAATASSDASGSGAEQPPEQSPGERVLSSLARMQTHGSTQLQCKLVDSVDAPPHWLGVRTA